MMKNISKIILAILVCLCLTVSAYGAPLDRYEIDDVKESVTIYGSVEGAQYLDRITIEVLKPGVEVNRDIPTKESIKEDFIHITQLLADKDGAYSLEIDMSGQESAFYEVRVNGELGENKFFFATTATKESRLGEIKRICNAPNNAATITRLVNALDSANPDSVIINMFGVNEPLVSQVDAELLAKTFYGLVKEDATITATPAGFKRGIETATHLIAMNDGKGDASLYGAELGVSEEMQKIYSEELSAEAKASFIANNFKGKELLTLDAAKTAYEDGVILAYIASVNSYSDVETIIELYGKEIGVDMDDYDDLKSTEKTKLYEYIAEKNNLTSFEDFSKAVNSKAEDILDDRKDSSGGGSGGGFGGGSTGNIVAGSTQTNTPIIPTDTSGAFSDMEGYDWASEAVNALYEKGMVSGTGDNLFAPGREITREEMVAMLIRAFGFDTELASDVSVPFTDVDASAWYAPYIKIAYEKGYVAGVSDTEFGLGRIITREEAATMANRIAISMDKVFAAESEPFTDDSLIADYAKDHVYALKNAGVISGIGDGSFAPKSYCNRAQAAVIIYTLINK